MFIALSDYVKNLIKEPHAYPLTTKGAKTFSFTSKKLPTFQFDKDQNNKVIKIEPVSGFSKTGKMEVKTESKTNAKTDSKNSSKTSSKNNSKKDLKYEIDIEPRFETKIDSKKVFKSSNILNPSLSYFLS